VHSAREISNTGTPSCGGIFYWRSCGVRADQPNLVDVGVGQSVGLHETVDAEVVVRWGAAGPKVAAVAENRSPRVAGRRDILGVQRSTAAFATHRERRRSMQLPLLRLLLLRRRLPLELVRRRRRGEAAQASHKPRHRGGTAERRGHRRRV